MQGEKIEGFRLSPQQRHLWLMQQKMPNQPYRSQCLLLIEGALDTRILQKTLADVVARHEILRTTFRFLPGITMPLQFIAEDGLLSFHNCDLRGLDPLEQEVEALFHDTRLLHFDFAHGPLFYTSLITLTEHRHLLLIALPALCADAWTLKNLMQEINRSYRLYVDDEAYTDEAMQYVDFSEWQNELLQEEGAEARQAYWRKVNWSQAAAVRLPFEGTNSIEPVPDQEKLFNPQVLDVALEATTANQILAFSQSSEDHLSSSAFLLACWQVLLWRFTAEPDLLIGLACDGRHYEELSTASGLFTRVVPIRASFEQTWSFSQTLKQVTSSLAKANEYQDYFIRENAPSLTNDERKSPWMPIGFEWETWPDRLTDGPVRFSLQKHFSCIDHFTLKLTAFHVGQRLHLELHYDPLRLPIAQVRYLAGCLRTLLCSALAHPHAPVKSLELLDAEKRQRLLRAGQGIDAEDPCPQLLHQLFEAQVQLRPYQPAVVCGTEQLTYQQLNRQANQLAHFLRQRGVGPNVFVGLCLERSTAMLVGLLGILKAGGAYVPLDPDAPVVRLTYQLQEIRAPLVLTQETLLDRLPPEGGPYFCLDNYQGWLVKEPDINLPGLSGPEDLAYMIYTSGSTGTPKGVLIRHQSLINYALSIGGLLELQPEMHFATVSTMAADLGNTSIFGSLISGGCLHVLEYTTLISGEAMARYMQQHPIDVLKIVPSHLTSLLATACTRHLLPRRYLVLGGEAFSMALLKRLQALEGECRILNHYGPTEATVGTLVHAPGQSKGVEENGEGDVSVLATVPIGRPIASTEVYILDSYGQMAPAGVTGELYIGGSGLATGYLNQPEQTAARFVPHPFSRREGARLYRTGDLVRYTTSGEIEFIGRADRQIKLRGYRIELGEIEIALSGHPNVRENIVMSREAETGEARLVAYVTSKEQPRPTSAELRGFLEELLPEYMVPAAFVLLDAMPLTANGKVDRRKLPLLENTEHATQSNSVGPRSPIEEILVGVWEKVLKVKHLGVQDNFFSLGGHSLLATQIISYLRTMLQIEVPLRTLFEVPTIAGLAPQVELILRGGRGRETTPLLPVSHEGQLPLSFAQQRLWFLDQLDPGGTAYNIPVAVQLSGPLNVEALERSLHEIVRRHEVLRTTFHMHDGQPVQIIEPSRAFHLPLAELGTLPPETRQSEVSRIADQEFQRPFNLEQGPLLQTMLLRLRKDEHILLISMHHIASDGWSSSITIHELTSLYRAYVEGNPSPLAELPIQYADFACWQRQWLQGAALEAQLAYWTRRLTGIVPLEFPSDQPRLALRSQRGARQSVLLPPSLSEKLKALSQNQEVTLFMTLMAAFQVLLARYTGQMDVSVGTPIANRTQPEIEGLIGFFVNTLVLRTDLTGNPSFLELLERVREVALGAYAHQDLPFEKLVEALQPERDLSRSPLFQILFILQHAPQLTLDLADVKLKPLAQETKTARYDLTLSIMDAEQGLDCAVEYSTDLFMANTIGRLLTHWQTLLEGIVAHPEQRLADLPLLTVAEQQELLAWNDTERAYPGGQCIQQLIEEQVERAPEAIALSYEEEQVSYGRLNAQANWLAHILVAKGIEPEMPVALLAERSIASVSSILAIFKAGGVYLPLDPLHPHSRLCQVLEQCRCPVVLVDIAHQHALERALEDTFPEERARPVVIQLESLLADQQAMPDLPVRSGPRHLAYVIYTSGSTGIPKGVMVEHGGMLNHIFAKLSDVQFSSTDCLAQNGPQCFDISVWQSLAPLLLGGRVVIVTDEVALDPAQLLATLEEKAISVLQLVPSTLRAIIAELGTEGNGRPALSTLRWLVPTGDALPADVCREWLRLYPAIPLLNTYGSTECSDDQCHFPIDNALPPEDWTPIMPIGRPIGNMSAYILDWALNAVPLGAVGDLYIGGAGVGRGYLNDPERTARAFLPDPWGQQAGGRLYKTGDTARRLPNGVIEFLGRSDLRVKVRGYRIELSEIETVLEQHPEIVESVVIAREGKGGERQLIAYIVPSQHPITASHLRNHLEGKLPGYMIPSHFVLLEALPLTSNGKLDRQALPVPDPADPDLREDLAAPLDPLQEVIATIWANIFGLERVGIHENFFGLGGHSLLATQVISRIRTMLHVELPLRTLFEAPTVAGLAARVERALRGEQHAAIPPVLPAPRDGDLPLSFAQQRLWFLDQLEPGNAFYNLATAVRLSGTLDVGGLERSLQEVVRRHESLRTTFITVKGRPGQVIGTGEDFVLRRGDLSGLASDRRTREAQRLAQEEARQPFDLARGPLLRTVLLQLSEHEYVLLLTLHHIVTDGWSMAVFVREFSSLYATFVQGTLSLLPEPSIQYADFAYWQRQWFRDEILLTQLDYWKKQLAGSVPLNLPTDRPRTVGQSHRGARYRFALPLELSRELMALSRQEGVTLFMTLLAAFQILLYRYTGQDDVVVGTDIANRTRAETEAIIGFFVNLLMLRTNLRGNPLFRQVLSDVRQMVLDAYTHQDLPFEMLVEALRLERQANQVPLVQVLFVLQNTPEPQPQLPDLILNPFEIEATNTRFNLAVFLLEGAEGLSGVVNYSTDLFEESTIATMIARFEVLLRGIVQQPDASVDGVEIYTEAERVQWARERQVREAVRQKKLQTSRREEIELPLTNLKKSAGNE